MLNLRKNEPRVIALSPEALLPGERKLILKRLRPPPRSLHLNVSWILVAGLIGLVATKKALLLIAGLFRKPVLVRKVGPNDAPLPEQFWEESHHLQSINARIKL
jgi:hypothetical protein